MRRLISIIAVITLFTTTVYAQNNSRYNDQMMEQNHMQYGQMRDRHMDNRHMNNEHMMRNNSYQMNDSLIKNSDEAKIRLETFIKDSGLKGYKVGRVETMTYNNTYNMYIVNTTDAAGNKMLFRVYPDGYITGPSTELTAMPRR